MKTSTRHCYKSIRSGTLYVQIVMLLEEEIKLINDSAESPPFIVKIVGKEFHSFRWTK